MVLVMGINLSCAMQLIEGLTAQPDVSSVTATSFAVAVASAGFGGAQIDPFAQLQSDQPFHVGGVHQRACEIAMVGIPLGIDCDRSVEVMQRLCVLARPSHDPAPRRFD